MSPEEQLAHLRDGDAWNLSPLPTRSAQAPRRPRLLVQIAIPIAVGLVAAAVVTIGVTAVRRGAQPLTTPTATSTASLLTPDQRTIAISIARKEASGASPDDAGIKQPIPSNSWPSYVTGVQAIANLTDAQAGRLTASTNSDQTGVIVVRMTGDFVVEHSAPVGASTATHGGAIEVVVDATTGQVLDFGVGPESAYPPLPNAEVLFDRKD